MSGTDDRDVPRGEGASFGEALARASQEGYLGDVATTDGLLRALTARICDRLAKAARVSPEQQAQDVGADMREALKVAAIFRGEVNGFTGTTLHTKEGMAGHILKHAPDVMDGSTNADPTDAAVVEFITVIYESIRLQGEGATENAKVVIDDGLERFSRLFAGLPMEPQPNDEPTG